MTLSASVAALRTAARRFLGSGTTKLYADPRLLVAFAPEDDEFAAYEARILACATKYTYLALNTDYDVPQNTVDSAIAHFDALDPADRAGPVMANIEYPWLEILAEGDSGSVDPSWVTDDAVLHEFDRQGVNGGTPVGATLAEMQTVAEWTWRDFTTYAKGEGCAKLIHYAATGSAFSMDMGVPMGQVAYSGGAPPSGKHWWLVDIAYRKTLRDEFDAAVSDSKVATMLRAQIGADAYGAGCYCLVPNGDRAVAAMPNWTHAAVTRMNGASAVQQPDFSAAELRWAVKNTSRRMWAETLRSVSESIRLGKLSAADAPRRVAAIVLGGALQQQVNSSPSVQFQWSGCDQKHPTRTAEDEIAALYMKGDRDAGLCRGPDEVWIWHDVRYYFITEPTRAVTGELDEDYVKTTNMARNTMEIAWLGRAAIAGDEPWADTSHAAHHAWYAANRLADAYWSEPSSVWWTPGGGSQLPAACDFDPLDGPLAPYLALVDPDYAEANITQAIAVRAMRHAVSETSVSYVEAARAALDAIRR